ncbi:MAG: hypothetical protein ACLSVX_12555 [Massilimicrobiota timonensis]
MDDDAFEKALYIAITELNMTEEDFMNTSPFLFEKLVSLHANMLKQKNQKIK